MENKKGAITPEVAKKLAKAYQENPKNKTVRHAISRTPITNAAYNNQSFVSINPSFSVLVKTMPVANQRSSGRCWIFAGLNILREIVAKKNKIKKFELSQNYISLFDKIEKANYALETLISLADREHDDRVVDYILTFPLNDGGQWDMFVNLVKKYGLVPQSVFPETYHSNNTRELDQLVSNRIREFGYLSHKLYVEGRKKEIRPLKEKFIASIYDTFMNAFGVPPEKFDFEYMDEKDNYHIEKDLTPLGFLDKYVGDRIDQYVSLIHYPEDDRPYMKNYTVEYLGNVVEGKPINHLNLPMERIKELVIKQLEDGEPVWFGSDVSFYRDRDRASFAWDSKATDYEDLFGYDIKFGKSPMLYYRASAMNHAMLITGVNLKDGKPDRWKIENSWGEDNGLSGYYVMSKEFFDEFVYQAVVLRRYLNKEEQAAADGEPVVLPVWDPMGSLAD